MPGTGDTIICPVKGCSYSNSISSVAAHVSGKKDNQHKWPNLGYGGYHDFISQQKESQDSPETVLVHMTDSHIGKPTGGHYKKEWPIDPFEGFKKAVSTAVRLDADAVLHTGDLFHNDTDRGITETHKKAVGYQLEILEGSQIPFYYIMGNHEEQPGKAHRDRLEKWDLARALDNTPELVGEHLALYGLDHREKSWWDQTAWTPSPPPKNRKTILALHQKMRQFNDSEWAECDAHEIIQRAQSRSGFQLDAIAVGEHHRDERTSIDGCDVLCGGATERISKRNFDPFVRVFEADSKGLNHRKVTLDL